MWDRADAGPLSRSDLSGIAKASRAAAASVDGVPTPAPKLAPDHTVALVPVTLRSKAGAGAEADKQVVTAIDTLRARLDDVAPAGPRTQVTGAPAFTADLANIFDGADTRLLTATALVVALLLLLTYRSSVLVVLPLLVVGVTEQSALVLAHQVMPRLGLPAGGAPSGIAIVLVFGAVTNYTLLLIARYREHLEQ